MKKVFLFLSFVLVMGTVATAQQLPPGYFTSNILLADDIQILSGEQEFIVEKELKPTGNSKLTASARVRSTNPNDTRTYAGYTTPLVVVYDPGSGYSRLNLTINLDLNLGIKYTAMGQFARLIKYIASEQNTATGEIRHVYTVVEEFVLITDMSPRLR